MNERPCYIVRKKSYLYSLIGFSYAMSAMTANVLITNINRNMTSLTEKNEFYMSSMLKYQVNPHTHKNCQKQHFLINAF